MQIAELLEVLWRNYIGSAPHAERIHRLLTHRGEILIHDCIALRTFAASGIGLDALARPFEALGWRRREHYRFADEHVRACYWQHAEPALPKVLISELVIDELSAAARAAITALVVQLPVGFGERADLPWAGHPWQLSYPAYQALLAESEHAAWLAAFGFRVHRFTVDVGSLSTFPDLAALDAFLIEHGFALDERGGLIRGSPAKLLETSATHADTVAVAFDDITALIPSCCYEFLRRHALPSGQRFDGFVAPST